MGYSFLLFLSFIFLRFLFHGATFSSQFGLMRFGFSFSFTDASSARTFLGLFQRRRSLAPQLFRANNFFTLTYNFGHIHFSLQTLRVGIFRPLLSMFHFKPRKVPFTYELFSLTLSRKLSPFSRLILRNLGEYRDAGLLAFSCIFFLPGTFRL